MAKIIRSDPTSGKVGSIVYSRNRWGTYIRRLVMPVQPRTPPQVTQRDRVASIAEYWHGLSGSNRLQWDAYAGLIVRSDRLGQPLSYNGYTAFMLINVERLVCGEAVIDLPPEMWDGYQPDSMVWGVTAAVMTLTHVCQGVTCLVNTGTNHLLAESCQWQSLGAYYPKTWRLFYVSPLNTAFPIDLSAAWGARFGAIQPSGVRRYFLRVRMVNVVDPPVVPSKFYVSFPLSDTAVSALA